MLKPIRAALYRVFFALGVALSGVLATGFFLDLSSGDQTRGAYEPPYVGYTGTPINWRVADQTLKGMARRGYVTTMLVNCTTGMISIEIFKQEIEFRVFSPRAIAIHKPREACNERGFEPRF
jgi:hypothetical protein